MAEINRELRGPNIFDHLLIFVKTISFSSNEMATAAMRFGHSLINGVFTLVKDNGVSDRSNNLTELFFDSDIIYRDGKCLEITCYNDQIAVVSGRAFNLEPVPQ